MLFVVLLGDEDEVLVDPGIEDLLGGLKIRKIIYGSFFVKVTVKEENSLN